MNNKVVIISEVNNRHQALEAALEQSSFWEKLEESLKKSEVPKEAFTIFIKPDMEFYAPNAPTGTDPALVEHLVDLLAEKGFTNILIGEALQVADMWLENRDVMVLADLVGYQFVTAQGNDYEIVNLSEDLVAVDFPDTTTFSSAPLSEHWLQAHFRINFAKNKTDEEHGFALALQNLMGILPLKAKDYHYFHRWTAPEVMTDLLGNTRIDFTLIDAWLSNHGSQGQRHSNPIETRTLIASDHLLLADFVAATKMGTDPYTSPLNAQALREIGLPAHYDIQGDLSPYPEWKNPSIHIRRSTEKRNQNPALRQLSKAWLYEVDTEIFPFKNVADEQINQFVTPLISHIDEHPLGHWSLIGLNYLLGNLHQMQEAWKILYQKDKLYRQEKSLGFDPKQFQRKDFEAIPDYILPLAQIVRFTPPDNNGLKWRYIDESVLFEYRKILPVTYEEFIEKVDIAQAVVMMYDNIGGKRMSVRTDRQNRVIHQAERDIYLPQPNWMVLFGGQYIDVGKIELVRYGKDRQEIFWRTVDSQNDSARFDDGMVSFAPNAGGTEVVIVARQQFALPLFWQVVNIDYAPMIKDSLVSDAYIRFFSRTMANFEAAAEGRVPYIGKNFDPVYGTEEESDFPLGIEQLKNILSLFSTLLQRVTNREATKGGSYIETDEQGYRHFRPSNNEDSISSSFRYLVKDLSEAVQKDIDFLRQKPK
jgi:uncharacterized protein (DUF362 family)